MARLAFTLLALALLPGLAHATPRRWQTRDFDAMATRISLVVAPGVDADGALAEVRAIFERLEQTLSEWRPGSPLAAVNQAAGRAPVVVPSELLDLSRRAIAIGALSDGAFDLTWAALWPLWTFRGEHPAAPSPEAVSAARALVDYRKVIVDEAAGTLFLPRAGMKIGLGGIAKGYALDRAAERLHQLGVHDFLLSAGGQILTAGTRDGVAWRVGIRDPRGPESDYFARLEVGSCSLSTSGDYERFFVQDGVRYHHIIDPRTGWPSRGLRSATAIAPDGTLADALSTAFMVLGVERALALTARLRAAGQEVEALLVDDEARVHMSPGLDRRLELRHPPRSR